MAVRRLAFDGPWWCLLNVAASYASASVPASGGGTTQITAVVVTNGVQADGNTIVSEIITSQDIGTLVGTSVFDVTLVLHPNGLGTYTAMVAFTGSVNGMSGTMTYQASDGIVVNQIASNEITSIRGTGARANLPSKEAPRALW